MSSSYSTPTSKKSYTPRNSDTPSMSLTPSEQDRQARGKNPYADDDDDFSDGYEFETGDRKRFDEYSQPTYESLQSRREAAVILDSPELLMMHAQARQDSIAGTRHYFTKLLCGYNDENDSYSEPSTKKFMSEGAGGGHGGGGEGGAKKNVGGPPKLPAYGKFFPYGEGEGAVRR